MASNAGPYGNLKKTARRSSRAGKAFIGGNMMGQVYRVSWQLQIAQTPVPMPGFKDGAKPGAESYAGTFGVQDVDDHFTKLVLDFCEARARGDRAGAQFPEFDLIVVNQDIGAPADSRYAIYGCELFTAGGGFDWTQDSIGTQDIPFVADKVKLLDGFEYTDGGVRTL